MTTMFSRISFQSTPVLATGPTVLPPEQHQPAQFQLMLLSSHSDTNSGLGMKTIPTVRTVTLPLTRRATFNINFLTLSLAESCVIYLRVQRDKKTHQSPSPIHFSVSFTCKHNNNLILTTNYKL